MFNKNHSITVLEDRKVDKNDKSDQFFYLKPFKTGAPENSNKGALNFEPVNNFSICQKNCNIMLSRIKISEKTANLG